MNNFSSFSKPIVDQISALRITGNITPPILYKRILRDNGKADHLGIAIFVDILYWYRPSKVEDPISGKVTGIKKKFRADLLQKSYSDYAEKFNESKRSVKAAFDRLEKQGFIRREFRTIHASNGMALSNVMYIEIIPDRIKEIIS